jgi:penicillin-binding protein 1A
MDMIKMMNSVVENGTGRRAELDGVPTAGKTGTTNDWRDAWFVGYTGNFVGAVWMGNDDYSPTKRMTGGTLPAMTWHNIMTYAHQGVELRTLPGMPAPTHTPALTDASFTGNVEPHPALLTRKATDALITVEQMLDDANHALSAEGAAPGSLGALDDGSSRTDTLAAAGRNAATSPRGD